MGAQKCSSLSFSAASERAERGCVGSEERKGQTKGTVWSEVRSQ